MNREEFLLMCEQRHTIGKFMYGEWDINSKDWETEAIEELADAVNYMTYLAMKLDKIKQIRIKNGV